MMLGGFFDELHADNNGGMDNAAVLPAVSLINSRLFMKIPYELILLFNGVGSKLHVARHMFPTCNMQPVTCNALPSKRSTISLISLRIK